MKKDTLEKLVEELAEIPENKANSIFDYVHFIKWENDEFDPEEINTIRTSEVASTHGEGVNWRNVRNDI